MNDWIGVSTSGDEPDMSDPSELFAATTDDAGVADDAGGRGGGSVAGSNVILALSDPDIEELVSDAMVVAGFTDTQAQRRELFANECRLLAEVEVRGIYRHEGHASIYGWLRAHYGYSNAECRQRATIARASLHLTAIIDAISDGSCPIAHGVALSKAINDCYADPNTDRDRVMSELGFWLNETHREHADFNDRITNWVTDLRADTTIDEDQSKHESRYCHIRRRRNGMISIDALLDPLSGSHLQEVWGAIAGDLFDSDWAAARAIHGDDTTTAHLDRTSDQRHADALTHLARLAQAHPDSGIANNDLVTILVDEHTFTDAMIRYGLYPTDARLPREHINPTQRCSRTNTGTPIHPSVAAQAAIEGRVRFTMVDKLMRPLATTSSQRLFTGANRDAIMAISPTCVHPGSNRRLNQSQADHDIEHQHGGPTSLTNATGPLCSRHNQRKSRHHYRYTHDTRGVYQLPSPHLTQVRLC